MSKPMIISADCHAGTPSATYREYLPQNLRSAHEDWQAQYEKEMAERTGTFFDQEVENDRTSNAAAMAGIEGEWDPAVRIKQLEDDGIAGEIIFPQTAPVLR